MESKPHQVRAGARTYCIINEQNQPAAKECNRKLYYSQKLKKIFCASENGTLTVSDHNSKNFSCVSENGTLTVLDWTVLLHMFQK